MSSQLLKRLIAAFIFVVAAILASQYVPSIQIAWVTGILLLTIYLFAFEIVNVDVAAIFIMVLLGITSLSINIFGWHWQLSAFMGLTEPLVDSSHLFDGFASNAVMSIIAVMVIGAGLDKTGLMSKVANFILRVGGSTEKRIIPIISSTVGIISSFMQNVGAAALFIPVVSRISARTGLPLSRLLMPMGFCAILGGTVTMIGSSPLILLNDLIKTTNSGLAADQQMETFGLFSVTPIGLALVATGILYFVIAGRFILPTTKKQDSETISIMDQLKAVYGLNYELVEVHIPANNKIIGRDIYSIEYEFKIRIVAINVSDQYKVGPGTLDRDTKIDAHSTLGIMAADNAIQYFLSSNNLTASEGLDQFADILSTAKAGIAEIVIPPGSKYLGQTARDAWLRKSHGLSILALHRIGETVREGEGVRDIPFQAGDMLICHTNWNNLTRLTKDKNFVVVTTEYPHEELRPKKLGYALTFFSIALALVLFSDIRLSIALLTGALGMILSGVLTIDEAYEAVSWKTVFLLASLIPLGMAVQTSGTAAYIADLTLTVLDGAAIWQIQLAIAVLATFFTLVMSNVGATVLLVPLAVNIAIGAGANPAVFALTVAIATSNSFLIPTHQVNALIMGPAGYRVPDFMKAGGIMTILFLVVLMVMMNLLF